MVRDPFECVKNIVEREMRVLTLARGKTSWCFSAHQVFVEIPGWIAFVLVEHFGTPTDQKHYPFIFPM